MVAQLLAFSSLAQGAPAPAPLRIALIESLSGPFANTGEAVLRNLVWATERINDSGGVKLPGGSRPRGHRPRLLSAWLGPNGVLPGTCEGPPKKHLADLPLRDPIGGRF